MKYLLLAVIVLWFLFYVCYKSADRSGDDFGAAVPAIFFFVVAVIVTLVYIGRAFWVHSFL